MSAAAPRRSPYQGLTPFDESDARYFFGREKDARLISADLFAAPLSVLYGPSGVGKSSVLRAGVVPLLRPARNLLVVVFSTWQSEPTAELKGTVAQALYALGTNFMDDVLSFEHQPLATFLAMCAKLLKRRLMIILDQFEEYSLYHPEGGMFSEQFPPATSLGDLSVSFLISLREDALAGLDRFEGKIPGLFDNLRRIDHLDGSAARDAIRKPLKRYAQDHADEIRITADDDLVEAVVEDVRANRIGFEGTGRGAEIAATTTFDRVEAPYLQLVMTRLWDDARTRGVTSLELGRFVNLGKAKQIVDDHLGGVVSRLTEEERDAAARVFEFLVTPSGTKIAHTVRDLSLSAGVDATLLQTMMERLSSGRDRVLRPVAALPDRVDEQRYEIFHDRLAPAILAWRTDYVQKKKLAEVNLAEIERRRGLKVDLGSSEPKSRGATTGEPPYALWADLLHAGKLTIVLGSGASVSGRPGNAVWQPGGPHVPTSSELTQYLAHLAGFPPDELGPGSLGEVASYFAAVAGAKTLQRELQDLFMAPSEPAPIHSLVAKAAARTPFLIVTNTFDVLLDNALDDAKVLYGVATNHLSDGELEVLWREPSGEMHLGSATAFGANRRVSWIYKLVGSVRLGSPKLSGFIITEEEAMSIATGFNNGVLPPPAFAAPLQDRTLFLGMGFRTWTERLLISKLIRGGRRERRWAVSRDVSVVDAQNWAVADIKVFDRDLNEVAAHLGAALDR
jgi:hypothetical protein